MKKKKWLSVLTAAAMVIAMIPAAVFAEGTDQNSIKNITTNQTYSTLNDALQAAEANQTITLEEGTYSPTANEQLRITDNGLTIKGAEGTDPSKVIIDAGNYSVSGQAGVMVEADNVTLEGLTIKSTVDNGNVSAVKFTKIADSMDNPLITSGTIKNVTLSSTKGHALNIHGVENMIVDGVNITNAGKCCISIANSPNVTVTNTTTGKHGTFWAEIGIMYKANDPAYTNASHLVLGSGNDFGTSPRIYSERPASSGSVDSIEATPDSGLVINVSSNGKWAVTADNAEKPAPVTNETNGLKYQTLEAALKDAASGDTILLSDSVVYENVKIDKAVTLKNAEGANPQVTDITAIGDIDGLTFEGLTFVGASNIKNSDINLSALYLQGGSLMKNVTVKNCDFILNNDYVSANTGSAEGYSTIAITTLNVEGLTVEGCTIDGYTITAYHNPGNGGSIAYKNNTVKNVKSGIAFIATKGITVTGNTFENANGIRLEDNWGGGEKCSDVTIEQNKFISVSSDSTYGQYAIRTENSNGVSGYEGTLELKENYWGENPDFGKLVVGSVEANVYPYYTDAEMSELATEANGIAINYSAEMKVGETLQLTATVSPDNAGDKTVTWSSSDDFIATVDQNGLVTAKAEGKVVITATNSAGQSANCTITVKAASTGGNGNTSSNDGTASEVTPSEDGSSPQTGDFSNMMPWMVIMLLALSASVACVAGIRKNKVR